MQFFWRTAWKFNWGWKSSRGWWVVFDKETKNARIFQTHEILLLWKWFNELICLNECLLCSPLFSTFPCGAFAYLYPFVRSVTAVHYSVTFVIFSNASSIITSKNLFFVVSFVVTLGLYSDKSKKYNIFLSTYPSKYLYLPCLFTCHNKISAFHHSSN